MTLNKVDLTLLAILAGTCSSAAIANSITEALTNGKTSANLNLRYENVSQDNAKKDADALTLRTRLTYATGSIKGFSSLVEFEDSRNVFGIDDYNNTLGKKPSYSVIADPETSELDQFFLKYQQKLLAVKAGRQVITMDNHRFVGHVGWRQDRQTFDGLTIDYQPIKNLSLQYGYITKRNRIFAEAKDIDAKDHLINASYKTPAGKITVYSYLLEMDNGTENGLDTYGLRFNGSSTFGMQKVSYNLEYASQESDSATTPYQTDYISVEVSTALLGIGFKAGYELLGSDDGMYGFSTPLATLHKFNGWSDQFLATPKEGLADLYASIGGKFSSGKWAVIYHKFDANEASATVDDLGSEINAVYSKNFTKNYSAGIKLASYSAGDVASAKVDTDKIWVWVTAKF